MKEIKIKLRPVHRLDGTIPFHRKILKKNDTAAELTNYLSF